MRVPGTGNALGPQACQRPAQIFDGRMRYTLKFAYKRMEQVKAEKGYQGPVVVCAVTFVAARRLHPLPRRPQISGGAARHGDLARADRRHPRAGAVPDVDSDAARAWASCRPRNSCQRRSRRARPPRRRSERYASVARDASEAHLSTDLSPVLGNGNLDSRRIGVRDAR